MVQQADLANQSDIQGTFRLSHFLTRVLSKLGCMIFMLLLHHV